MEKQHVDEVVACLPQDRTKFYYFKDRYALMLLSYQLKEECRVCDLKQSQHSRLLARPVVKDLLARSGRPLLTREMVDGVWPDGSNCYLLTLGKWGGEESWWQQTSRPGWNLVLQLNFSAEHDRPYQQYVKPKNVPPFSYGCHPVAQDSGRNTLAWARLDFDLKSGEALIEEIQNDWIRLAMCCIREFKRYQNNSSRYLPGYIREVGGDYDELSVYIDSVLRPHIAVWQEAMLMAAIWFLKEEIGISTIFYHTFETGCQLKQIDGSRLPPRSLYTQLPEQFCFKKTKKVPGFLYSRNSRKKKRVIRDERPQFYLLQL